MKAINYILAAIFLSLAFNTTHAATIKKIIKKKYFLIDEGPAEGFKKSAKVCVYDGEKKIACGKVVKSKGKKSVIRVSKSKTKLVKKGFTVNLYKKKSKSSAKPIATSANKKESRKFALSAGYLLTASSPSAYNINSYIPPYDESGQAQKYNTLWKKETSDASSLIGFAGTFDYYFGGSKLGAGARYRAHQPRVIESNYDISEDYLTSNISASALGFWLDYYFNLANFGSFSLSAGGGGDIDISDIAIKIDKQSADGSANETYYEVTSSLSTISLRLVLEAEMSMGFYGFRLNTHALIPIMTNPTFSAEISDPQVENYADEVTAANDFEETLAHRKQGYGLEILMSTYLSF